MTFKPGQSGNPNGRKPGTPNKITAQIKAVAGKHAIKAIEELARIAQKGESDAVRVAAARELLDRTIGKSPQAIGGSDELPPVLAKIVHEYIRPQS